MNQYLNSFRRKLTISFLALISINLSLSAQDAVYAPVPDVVGMNVFGNVAGIEEHSYYSGAFNNGIETNYQGGIFDDCNFLSCVYSDEHLARIFYGKWFLYQVSDCEMQFNRAGNIIYIKSLNDFGGQVYYKYDNYSRVEVMDARSEYSNQNEGVIYYYYTEKNGRIENEKVRDGSNGTFADINYQYDIYSRPYRAVASILGCDDTIVSYNDGRISRIHLKNYWGDGLNLSIKIDYNTAGNIERVTTTGSKSSADDIRYTSFDYDDFDSSGNWRTRLGKVQSSSGEVINIKTLRNYYYY